MNTVQKQVTLIPAKPARRKKRVAAYARVSSDSADQLNSFESQVRHYTKLIQENEQWDC